MDDIDPQFERIDAIVGREDDSSFEEMVSRYFEHLQRTLALPCEVTGIEDFRWEEPYVLGVGDKKEYAELRKTQPSHRDRYDLLSIKQGVVSEWILFWGEDIGAKVRRKSDGREFWLGLAELEAVDNGSASYQPLDDYAVFFANYR